MQNRSLKFIVRTERCGWDETIWIFISFIFVHASVALWSGHCIFRPNGIWYLNGVFWFWLLFRECNPLWSIRHNVTPQICWWVLFCLLFYRWRLLVFQKSAAYFSFTFFIYDLSFFFFSDLALFDSDGVTILIVLNCLCRTQTTYNCNASKCREYE